MDRRFFLKTTGAGASLLLGLGCTRKDLEAKSPSSWKPNSYIELSFHNKVKIYIERSEMGQGSLMGQATIMIDEADLDPKLVEFEHAPFHRDFNNREYGLQATGGSTSLNQGIDDWRELSARLRYLMVMAACELGNLHPSEVTTKDSYVINEKTGSRWSYGSLIKVAASIDSAPFKLKSKSEFNFIGKKHQRLDAAPKVRGAAKYGIDAKFEGAKIAYILHGPFITSRVKRIKNEESVLKDGVFGIYEISNGIAVLGDTYWHASQAALKLDIDWEDAQSEKVSSAEVYKRYAKDIEERGAVVNSQGNVESVFATKSKMVEAEYVFPFVAHKTMEPMNTSVKIENNTCHVITPTQVPALAVEVVKELTGFDEDQITIESTYIGGGFGRRLHADYVREAVEIALIAKTPIKLLWSREEDIQHDFYRPFALHRFRGTVDKEGKPDAWHHKIATQAILPAVTRNWGPALVPDWMPQFTKGMFGAVGSFFTNAFAEYDVNTEGAGENPYGLENFRVEFRKQELPTPIGFWRSVGHSHNGPAVECFIDELADAAEKDPFIFRRDLLPKESRHRKVLEKVAQMATWQGKQDADSYYGIAQHYCFKSYVAQIVKIKRKDDSRWKVTDVWCAADCGMIINPDVVVSQLESGIIFGLSNAIYDEITIEQNKVLESNYHDAPVLRHDLAPQMHIEIMDNDNKSTGVGEISVPTVIAALVNALSAAQGKRLRKFPLRDYFV